ncbi:unnamed protein product [Adineta steineri]|uniref:Uncharacterized protein n=2 Tax=Adineta steineri TaxID=433720 RepID=A0A819KWX9_9BILA|nr:unnamed protein product [Adineta steineri]CAF3685631.1 unnamed protein product [Adineta steineri]CAF3953118.1 unnamed protein product [Adineta steineri]CAF4018187.1 unnamed protein product [Adineta steineri]
MALSGAERARRYREKKKAAGLHELIKKQDRKRKRIARSKMSLAKLKQLRLRQQTNLHKFRSKSKLSSTLPSPPDSSFRTKQSKSKALNRILNVLPANKGKQFELIKEIATNLKIIEPEKKFERTQKSLSTDVKQQIYDYYFRDDISYQAPGKRDSITIKENGVKKKLQKRYLLYSLNEIYQMFAEENPQVQISCSSFKNLRPCNVLYKSATPHNLCLCIYHENVSLLLHAIDEHIHGIKSIDLNLFIKLLVCNDSQELCMFSNCNQCSNNFKISIQDKIINPSAIIKWSLWSTSNEGRTVKTDYEGTVQNCVNILKTKINPFLFHVFIKRQQSNYFEMSKKNVTDEKCVLQVDYSENFSIIEQNEIHSAHWSRKQLSIFTAYVWSQSKTYPLVIVSDDSSHDKFTVGKCLEHLFTRLKILLPSMKELIIFSDGSASQFKQRFLFKNLTYLANQFSLKLSWNFFASHHGKGNLGVVDGIGGSSKRTVYQDVMSGKRCRNAKDFLHLIEQKNSLIIIDELSPDEIELGRDELGLVFNQVKAVPNIQKVHSINVIDIDKIECKIYSNSDKKTTVNF